MQFVKENAKAKILGKSYLLKLMEPYSDVYVSVDMTKSERINSYLMNSNQGELRVK